MNKIKILDENTIDKIAAGEVVENPSSVVKELVENAIDSGADEIIIEIKNGGKNYIRVTDNGCGIIKEDIKIALQRHATSKINNIEDLNYLNTLGFRGEALSSISAVSKFELTSKTINEEVGTTIMLNGGKLIIEQFTGAPTGTTIIVRDLFFNVPARKKFLRSDQSESTIITDLITKLSLINSNITFKFIRDSNIIITTPAATSEINVISSIFGSDFSNSLLPIEFNSDEIKLKGYVTNLNYYRASRKMQLIYVNHRFISNKNISLIIEKAYNSLIPKGKFPGFILYLEINPIHIDVNIHPQKSIVKFDDIRSIEDLLFSLVSKKLRSKFLSKNVKLKTDKPLTINNSINITGNDFITNIEDIEELNQTLTNKPEVSVKQTTFNELIKEETKDLINENIRTDYIQDDTYNIVYEELRYIGTIFSTYLIFEDGLNKNMYLMDQHASHERINFENFINEYNNKDIHLQNLLIPELITLNLEDYEKTLSNFEVFKQLGFDVNDFGSKSINISSVPVIFSNGNIREMFYNILDDLKIDKLKTDLDIEKLIKKACIASIKAGDLIGYTEIKKLLNDLFLCKSPYTCPHGRPIWIKFTKPEIEKFFNRIK